VLSAARNTKQGRDVSRKNDHDGKDLSGLSRAELVAVLKSRTALVEANVSLRGLDLQTAKNLVSVINALIKRDGAFKFRSKPEQKGT
jgi:hypothetical protein